LLDTIWPDITAIEARVGKPRRRRLMGESMGGLNSLVLGLSQPQHFDKVAALCPNVYQESPFSPLSQIRAAMVRTGADPRIAFGIWQLARGYVSNAEEWRRISPLALIEGAAIQEARPSLYLSAGLYDRYGLYEGAERLAQGAAQRGLQTEWHPLYGGHCAIDIASLGAFLVR
jgi:S-formylglutathione hydrolase FrmB